jgi:hypothetical protein
MPESTSASILLPDFPAAVLLPGAVLFGFDDRAFPFTNHVETRLVPGQRPSIVLRHGPEGSVDQVLRFIGTVLRDGDQLKMWYDAADAAGAHRLGYATSVDGVNWERPELGLVEVNGSSANNIVNLPGTRLRGSAVAVLLDPDDPDPERRYKLVADAMPAGYTENCFTVAFSPDGLRWRAEAARSTPSPLLEIGGIVRYRGLYYVNGQGKANGVPNWTNHRRARVRRLVTFASADFEHWSPWSAMGLDRAPDLTGPLTDDRVNQDEEVHLGTSVWNRGNVLVGIYGQWHGHPTGDRRLVTMDLGLALSHDALHWQEPLPNFRIVPAREQPESPVGIQPTLMHGQGMSNVGDRTLYWFSLWRGNETGGVRAVSWERDRFGSLKPFDPAKARAISTPIQIQGGAAQIRLNVSGLGEHTRLRVNLVDPGFRAIPGYSGDAAAVVVDNGFEVPLRWGQGTALSADLGPVRLDIEFDGVRADDAKLHAVYLGSVS